MATLSAAATWRDVFMTPDRPQSVINDRAAAYDLLRDYYTNSLFEDLDSYSPYLSHFKLYHKTRSIYNPTRRLVDFYAGQVYPGVLSSDGLPLGDLPLAIPFNEDINKELRLAIAQLWQWSNWQSGKTLFVRTGAMTGSALVTVVDDPLRSKVLFRVVWPGLVDSLDLDGQGNVRGYAIEYQVANTASIQSSASTEFFTYRKEVDAAEIRTFKDGEPFGFDDNPSRYANPYGFVPAVWVKHLDTGTNFGAPAIRGSLGKLDELNSLASHIHDQIHKVIASPQLIATDSAVGAALTKEAGAEAGVDPREQLLLLKTKAGASVHPLAGNLSIDDAVPYLDHLIAEIEHDHPELGFWNQLRQMTQVTGPGAGRLLGDVQGNVWEAAANYDQQSIKLCQMAVAIAGWRLQQGDWEQVGSQQQKFAQFDLTSYLKGQLDFTIQPRPLVPMTMIEKVAEKQARSTAAVTLKGIISDSQIIRDAGYTEAEQKVIESELPKERAEKQSAAMAVASSRPAFSNQQGANQ